MQKVLSLKLLPSEAKNESLITEYIAKSTGHRIPEIQGFYITKSSIDARGRTIWVNLSLLVYINEPFIERPILQFAFRDISKAPGKVIVIGSGPAGLFAALKLIEKNIKPIILERGKDVRARRRDLATLNKEGILNTESNYCFGEGGAGTYSDGKLYTRSSKRGDINRILNLLVKFGAEQNILYEAHPHIGTNKLPHIITAIRKQIVDSGGEFLFEKKVVGFDITNDSITKVRTADSNYFEGDAVILATGHSARDIFLMLQGQKIQIESKPFALGVRIEHPQELIDRIQYHGSPKERFIRDQSLPPSSYSLVEQIKGCGVFSFCMCPGGIIAPASTNAGELVVNGWSPSKRNNPYANSGMVVTVEKANLKAFEKFGELDAMNFQKSIEENAFSAGGGKFVAPAQRMTDFVQNKISTSLPDCSYVPGTQSASLKNVLPQFIYESLSEGFKEFGKKMKGYFTNEAIVVATESRTSSPVRIPRDTTHLHHPQIKNLFPCGEGAGFAGGIVSAAMDGERIADIIFQKFNSLTTKV